MAALGENKKFSLGHVMFEMFLRHESRDVKWAVTCTNTELRGEVGLKITIWRVATMHMLFKTRGLDEIS
jgi:hypothetical protein